MILKLNGIDVDCVIGERLEERARTQRLRVDVELEIGETAADTDRLGDTVDYAALLERIRSALVEEKCQMIERAAKVAAEVCLSEGKVTRVRTAVTKCGAVAHLESASAIYEGKRA